MILRHESILLALHRYRYLTIEQVRALFYAAGSYEHASQVLKRLREIEYIAALPKSSLTQKHVYHLGKQGVKYLRSVGYSVSFRATSYDSLTYSQNLRHWLSTTDFLISAEKLPQLTADLTATTSDMTTHIQSVQIRHDLQLGKMFSRKLRPDGIIELFTDIGKMVFWLELDRGTITEPDKWQEKVKRITDYCYGDFVPTFQTNALTILFVTTSNDHRVDTMMRWTKDALSESEYDWFRFASVPEGTLDPVWVFQEPIWRVIGREGWTGLV